ncbi:Mandelate racemase/muconate lactonizing protein [Methylocella silvestris BL2]|uniref:Dipeptide epimerase n=1 Tax=Methylocella silvestris (strain DSM 15510 / CIP 108128 / LMG 27833 / NCIMB 13906 / BL2) TaxID=395965 RepID=B8ET84_METSB|nr:N-acetyl-D-Glu racemase DgcA [Methylocella silvestris]ACK51726.1 Mandelate racemase/muconate lactonizing protein [Methylocella silvestris BL2]
MVKRASKLSVAVEKYPIAGKFVISRGQKTEAVVVLATIADEDVDGGARGRGECVPYARYGESVDSVLAQIEAVRPEIEQGADRASLGRLLPPGAARNALDCALWDLAAKRSRRRAFELAGLAAPAPVVTAYTISVGAPEEMAAAAAHAAARPLLKIKLAGSEDPARIAAVRAAAPAATLIVDANEAWSEEEFAAHFAACEAARVALIEQPLPAGRDAALTRRPSGIPICADESVHARQGLEALRARYDAVNIKLDKTGGLTEMLAMTAEAEALGFQIVIGCMVGTSLAMAPALLAAARARFVDLDGPLLLARDREHALVYEGSVILPASAALWG